jgi:hypothetical protein
MEKKNRPVIIPNNETSVRGGGNPIAIFVGIIGFVLLVILYHLAK